MTGFDSIRGISGFIEDRFPDRARRSPFDRAGYDRRFDITMDVHEHDGHLVLECDLPGVPSDGVEVDVEDGIMTIVGRRERRLPGPKGERTEQRTFARSLQLPRDVDDDSIRAEMKDGVLRIHFDRRRPSTARRIEIA